MKLRLQSVHKGLSKYQLSALGVRLEQSASNLNEADFKHQTGKVHLVGNLTLNYVKVRCIADIDLETLEGKGHLEPIEE